MDRKSKIDYKLMTGEKPDRETIQGKLDLVGAEFKYPSRPDTQVLRGLTVGANPGQVIALVGPR